MTHHLIYCAFIGVTRSASESLVLKTSLNYRTLVIKKLKYYKMLAALSNNCTHTVRVTAVYLMVFLYCPLSCTG
jgi:hypothetical protein